MERKRATYHRSSSRFSIFLSKQLSSTTNTSVRHPLCTHNKLESSPRIPVVMPSFPATLSNILCDKASFPLHNFAATDRKWPRKKIQGYSLCEGVCVCMLRCKPMVIGRTITYFHRHSHLMHVKILHASTISRVTGAIVAHGSNLGVVSPEMLDMPRLSTVW